MARRESSGAANAVVIGLALVALLFILPQIAQAVASVRRRQQPARFVGPGDSYSGEPKLPVPSLFDVSDYDTVENQQAMFDLIPINPRPLPIQAQEASVDELLNLGMGLGYGP